MSVSKTRELPTTDTKITFDSTRKTGLVAMILVYVGFGLAAGISVFLIGLRAGPRAQNSIAGLMLWFFPYIGPVLGTVVGAFVSARMDASFARTVETTAVGAVLGWILMFFFTMPFIMAQPTKGALPPSALAKMAFRSIVGIAIAGGIGGYLGMTYR